MPKKHHNAIKKGEQVTMLSLRVTRLFHLDYQDIFKGNLIWYLSCSELSKNFVEHTHAAIILDKPLSRDQIVARLKNKDINGNESYSLGKWDGSDDYLRYICKDTRQVEIKEQPRYVLWGQPPLNFTHPHKLADLYWEINKQLKEAGKVAVAKTEAIEDFVLKHIDERFTYEAKNALSNQRRRELIVELCWEYFDHHGKSYHGNDYQFESFLNRMEHKVFAKIPSYKKFFIEKFTHRR